MVSCHSSEGPRAGCKERLPTGGGRPLQFGIISASNSISVSHEGMHFSLMSREIIVDGPVTVSQAERPNGSVRLTGCRKPIHGMPIASAPHDLASLFLYAGPKLWVPFRREDVRRRRRAKEPVAACTRPTPWPALEKRSG